MKKDVRLCGGCDKAKDLGGNCSRCMGEPNGFTFVMKDNPKHVCKKFVAVK